MARPEMNENQKNLIDALNRRLEESAKFWYQSVAEYQELIEFLSSLNALIQSLRNITFIIQSHKRDIADFDEWYIEKQRAMRQDQFLVWLVQARNRVVKQGDLKVNSIATATIKNWLEFELFSLSVDPFTTNEDIIVSVISAIENEKFVRYFREPILQIERTWRVDQFPDRELLSVLSHCYNQLKSVVHDLLDHIGVHSPLKSLYTEKDDSLKSGLASRIDRTVSIDLKDNAEIKLKLLHIPYSESYAAIASEQYGKREDFFDAQITSTSDPFESLDLFTKMSRKILVTDGSHAPMVYYYFDEKPPQMRMIPSEDKTQQYFHIRQIAEDIITMRIVGLIFILENWMYHPNNPRERTEGLTITCMTNDGRFESRIMPFSRTENGIAFDESIIMDSSEHHNWLRPILRAWNL